MPESRASGRRSSPALSLRAGFLTSGGEAGASVLTIAGLIDRWAEDGRLPDHLRLVPKLGGM